MYGISHNLNWTRLCEYFDGPKWGKEMMNYVGLDPALFKYFSTLFLELFTGG